MRRRAAGVLQKAPLEAQEQLQIVQWLTFRQHVFFHVTGNQRSLQAAIQARRLGAKAGIPDLFVLSMPRRRPARGSPFALRHGELVGGPLERRCAKCLGVVPFKGVAIEVKRVRGGRVSPAQRQWIEDLTALGWFAFVARGAEEAIRKLEDAGY